MIEKEKQRIHTYVFEDVLVKKVGILISNLCVLQPSLAKQVRDALLNTSEGVEDVQFINAEVMERKEPKLPTVASLVAGPIVLRSEEFFKEVAQRSGLKIATVMVTDEEEQTITLQDKESSFERSLREGEFLLEEDGVQ